MLAQPFYRLTTLGFVLASIGFLALMRGGWVSKEMLLDARYGPAEKAIALAASSRISN